MKISWFIVSWLITVNWNMVLQKKPALAEAVALNLADNTDARMETLTEIFAADKGKKEWLGYNRLFESNLRRTGDV